LGGCDAAVLPAKDYRIGVDLLEVLMNAIDQLLLAGHAHSWQHRPSHPAELLLNEIDQKLE
jgi:hypothetical protein